MRGGEGIADAVLKSPQKARGMSSAILHRLSVVPMLVLMAGCASGNLLHLGKAEGPKASPKTPVVKVLALWQPGDGIGLEETSCRGFGGQIYFFTQESNLPASVDGSVRVFLFDDNGSPDEQAKPLHQFEFSSEAWDTHRYENKLGTVYSVFIPYTRKGAQQAECSLQVRFTPKNGPVVHSEMTKLTLPGTSRPKGPDSETITTVTPQNNLDAAADPKDTMQKRLEQVVSEHMQAAAQRPAPAAAPANVSREPATMGQFPLRKDVNSVETLTLMPTEERRSRDEFEPRKSAAVRRANWDDDDRGLDAADFIESPPRSNSRRAPSRLEDEDDVMPPPGKLRGSLRPSPNLGVVTAD